MKLTIAILLASTTLATAGGLAPPITTTVTPPTQDVSRYGAYVGGSLNTTTTTRDIEVLRERTEVTTWEEYTSTVYTYDCARGESKDNHNNNKCVVDDYAWLNSPEIMDLMFGSGWDQNSGEPHKYQLGYNGIWLGGTESFTYTLDQEIADLSSSKPTTTTLISAIDQFETFTSEEIVTYLSEEEQETTTQTFSVHAGYRWEHDFAVTGVEATASEEMITLEGSVGFDVNDALFYGFAGVGAVNDDDVTGDWQSGVVAGVGAEYFLGGGWSIGAKQTFGEFAGGDIVTATSGGRVSFNF